jgi:hypothetical protein
VLSLVAHSAPPSVLIAPSADVKHQEELDEDHGILQQEEQEEG